MSKEGELTMVDIVNAWNDAVSYALQEAPELSAEDMVSPGAPEIYEFLDESFPELADDERRMAVDVVLASMACEAARASMGESCSN